MYKAGHDVAVMPVYLPKGGEGKNAPLEFSAVSYYVSQKFFRGRSLPKCLEKILNSKCVLNFASLFSGTTNPKGLEGLTLSMIRGESDEFKAQANKIITWIKKDFKPDVIHLSSSLLIGIAKTIKAEINLPIVCNLQDEEVWIDAMEKPFALQAWQGISEGLKFADLCIVPSKFYAQKMRQKFPKLKNLEIVYLGLEENILANKNSFDVCTLGFFNRLCEVSGLEILADAFIKIKRSNALPKLKLKIGGGFTSADKKFVKKIKSKLKNFEDSIEWQEKYDAKNHQNFYKDISALCVPIKFEEAAGIYLAESFAAGLPVIEPSTGSFPEIVDDGGLLYAPNDSENLASAIEKLFTDEALYNQCKANAKKLWEERYSDKILVKRLSKIYSKVSVLENNK